MSVPAQSAPAIEPSQEVKPSPQVQESTSKVVETGKAPTIEQKPEEKASQRFAALARKEKATREAEAKLSQRGKELEAREAQVKAFEEAKANKDYSKAAEIIGLSYEEWTQYLLNDNKPTPELQAKDALSEVEKLRNELAEKEKKAEEDRKKAAEEEYNQTVIEFKQEVNDFLLTNKAEYELIATTGTQEVVLAVIEQHFQATSKEGNPKVLSIKEAADLVEADLLEKAKKAAAISKVLAKPTPPSGTKEEIKQPTSAQQPRTLTSTMTSSSGPSSPALTEEDRIKRALAKLDKK